MSNENECPFEVGQWVTDGERCKRVLPWWPFHDKPRRLTVGSENDRLTHPDDVDWSKWVAFDPADIKDADYSLQLCRQQRDNALARVAELEAEARVVELTPPDGHVAVILPREDVEEWADLHFGIGRRHRVTEACRKALEARDVRSGGNMKDERLKQLADPNKIHSIRSGEVNHLAQEVLRLRGARERDQLPVILPRKDVELYAGMAHTWPNNRLRNACREALTTDNGRE